MGCVISAVLAKQVHIHECGFVYYLFDVSTRTKNIYKEVGMLLPKKELIIIQVEYIGKNNNYCEDIYIPPYNSTH